MTIIKSPPLEVIERLKEEHSTIFQVEYEGQVFLYRKFARLEYKEAEESFESENDLEDFVVSTAVLFPEDIDLDSYKPGTIELLNNAILLSSGLYPDQISNTLNFYKEQMMDMDYQIDCIIKEAFPEFSFEEMAEWEINKTIFYLSRAEWTLKNLRGVNIELFDVNEVVEEEEEVEEETHLPIKKDHQYSIKKEFAEAQKPELDEIIPPEVEITKEEIIEEEKEVSTERESSLDAYSQQRKYLESLRSSAKDISKTFDQSNSIASTPQEEKVVEEETEKLTDQLENKKIGDLSREEVRKRMKNFFMSENEVLNQFNKSAEQTGRAMNREITKIGGAIPEAAWFKAQSDLTGED